MIHGDRYGEYGMIYLFTALYCEAHGMIKQFGLKKVDKSTHFLQFYNEDARMRLTVSGVGEIAAAAAVASVCTEFQPGLEDFLVNIGICAGTPGQEGIFLIHKLTEEATGKTFYPDILYRHSFQERCLVTRRIPWDGTCRKDFILDAVLYDMEAAAVYQAGTYFFGPHQMVFLKLLSDHGVRERILPEQVEQLFALHRETISDFLKQLSIIGKECYSCLGISLHQQEMEEMERILGQLCMDLHATKAMRDSLKQYLYYAVLAGIDYQSVIRSMYQEKMLPCKEKREGKRCFEELKQRLY